MFIYETTIYKDKTFFITFNLFLQRVYPSSFLCCFHTYDTYNNIIPLPPTYQSSCLILEPNQGEDNNNKEATTYQSKTEDKTETKNKKIYNLLFYPKKCYTRNQPKTDSNNKFMSFLLFCFFLNTRFLSKTTLDAN